MPHRRDRHRPFALALLIAAMCVAGMSITSYAANKPGSEPASGAGDKADKGEKGEKGDKGEQPEKGERFKMGVEDHMKVLGRNFKNLKALLSDDTVLQDHAKREALLQTLSNLQSHLVAAKSKTPDELKGDLNAYRLHMNKQLMQMATLEAAALNNDLEGCRKGLIEVGKLKDEGHEKFKKE